MRFISTTLLVFLLAITAATAQQLTHRLGYLIVRIEEDNDLSHILSSYSQSFQSEITIERSLSARLGIYTIAFDHSKIHQGKLLSQLITDPRIMTAQYDHITTPRAIPDDPLLVDQWQWLNTGQTGGIAGADMGAERAWDITTGGLTALGDTIVVAIVDNGLDYNHNDIAANVWINYHEIDGNGIDDDGNGYVDDIYGWNAYDNTPDIWGQNHGLAVAGMVGAVGNNGIGGTGINWNVKLMTIVGGSPESAAIASYAYALEQRIMYNESNGEKGAFVVATNSSWGIDFGQPADAPLWCAFYDTLGAHGILSAAATANRNIDIDLVGDLPTGCSSDYLLSVTALNDSDQRTFSAWGLTTIDFGAPGDQIYTTSANNGYNHTSGTSFASPATAGVVALLYAAPCPGLAMLSRTNPAVAAGYVRDAMFAGVKAIPDLSTNTRFGGSLNVGNSMELLMQQCAACPIPVGISVDTVSDTLAVISWTLLDTPQQINVRYRIQGDQTWDTISNVSSPLLFNGLLGCSTYELEFESICADTTDGYLPENGFVFETDGCCELPAEFALQADDDIVYAYWSDVLAADYYVVQWRPLGEVDWEEFATPSNGTSFPDLEACTTYEFRIYTSCDTTDTDVSAIQTIRTKGCGNCIDLPYCEAIPGNASDEFLDSLIIGPIVNHSGNNGGYAFFDDLNATFIAGETYPIWLRPGFTNPFHFDQLFKIWIDYDQDGVFTENEIIVDSVLTDLDDFLSLSFTVPDTAPEGNTRMRVIMAFHSPFGSPETEPCSDIEFGEIEEYCIDIIRPADDCAAVDTIFFDAITFTSAFMYWNDVDDAIAYVYRYREVGTSEYTELAIVDTTANLSGLEKCKMYEVQLLTVCAFDTAGYVHNYILTTDCDVAVDEPNSLLSEILVYPNPVADIAHLRINSNESGEHHIAIFDISGKRIAEQKIFVEAEQETIVPLDRVEHWMKGLYFISISCNGKSNTTKLVKM